MFFGGVLMLAIRRFLVMINLSTEGLHWLVHGQFDAGRCLDCLRVPPDRDTKELIDLHGGELQISSVVGKGTTVSFTLPLSDPTG
jgi:hypothetical protein